MYFNHLTGVFFSNRLRSALIENEIGGAFSKGLKYSRGQLGTLKNEICPKFFHCLDDDRGIAGKPSNIRSVSLVRFEIYLQ